MSSESGTSGSVGASGEASLANNNDALENEIGALEAMLGVDTLSALLAEEDSSGRSVRPCRAAGCENAATCYAKVESQGEAKELNGFSVPACDRHAASVKRMIARLFEDPEVSVCIVPLPAGVRRWLRYRNHSRDATRSPSPTA